MDNYEHLTIEDLIAEMKERDLSLIPQEIFASADEMRERLAEVLRVDDVICEHLPGAVKYPLSS